MILIWKDLLNLISQTTVDSHLHFIKTVYIQQERFVFIWCECSLSTPIYSFKVYRSHHLMLFKPYDPKCSS